MLSVKLLLLVLLLLYVAFALFADCERCNRQGCILEDRPSDGRGRVPWLAWKITCTSLQWWERVLEEDISPQVEGVIYNSTTRHTMLTLVAGAAGMLGASRPLQRSVQAGIFAACLIGFTAGVRLAFQLLVGVAAGRGLEVVEAVGTIAPQQLV